MQCKKKELYLKSSQVYFKLTQLIGGTFRHFLKKSKQKSNQWHTTRKRTSPNSGCQKINSKLSGKGTSTVLGQFVVNLTRL